MPITEKRKAANRELMRNNLIVAGRIDAKTASLEAGLITTKWYDYRFSDPLTCTQLFVDAYIKQFKIKWSRGMSTETAPLKLGTHALGWQSNQREFTSFWRARQFADQYCIPYEFYVDHVLEFACRRGYTKIPRPNQMYSKKIGDLMADAAANIWVEWVTDAKFVYSQLPQYQFDNFRGLPAQYAHQDWVTALVAARHCDPRVIGWLLPKRLFSTARAAFEFGPNKLEMAARYTREGPELRSEVLDEDDFRPGCFGVAHAHAETRAECMVCPFAGACASWGGAIRDKLCTVSNTDDVITARKRTQVRDRVQKHRDKKRLAATAPIPPGI